MMSGKTLASDTGKNPGSFVCLWLFVVCLDAPAFFACTAITHLHFMFLVLLFMFLALFYFRHNDAVCIEAGHQCIMV